MSVSGFRLIARVAVLTYICVLLAPATARAQSNEAPKGTLAIVNAKLETITQGTIERGTVLIRDGRIVGVGPAVRVPEGVRVIDAKGRPVTPGMIASGTNLSLAEINLIATTREDAGGDRISAGFDVQYGVNPASTHFAIARETGVTHAMVSPLLGRAMAFEVDHAGLQNSQGGDASYTALFAGQAAVIRLAHGDNTPVMRARIAVALDLGEAGAQYAGGSRGATITLVKAALEDARHYARNKAAYQRGATREYGLPVFDLEALVPVVEGRTPLLIRVSRAADIRQALALAREEKVKVILENAEEAWLLAEEIAARGVPVVLDPQESLPRSFESLASRLDNAARLQRAGVLIAIKGSRNFNSVRAVRHNAGTAVAYGLSPQEALAAITINPARIWGIADRAGSLEVGKDGDVVLWSDDPLETLSHPLAVIIGGVEQPHDSRRHQLERRYAQPDNGYPPAYR